MLTSSRSFVRLALPKKLKKGNSVVLKNTRYFSKSMGTICVRISEQLPTWMACASCTRSARRLLVLSLRNSSFEICMRSMDMKQLARWLENFSELYNQPRPIRRETIVGIPWCCYDHAVKKNRIIMGSPSAQKKSLKLLRTNSRTATAGGV